MDSNIEHILGQNGVDKVAFYYKDAPLLSNAFTTCLFINTQKNRIEARGVSICSVRDAYCRKKGKQRAFGRAIKALTRKTNDEKINPAGRDFETVKRTFKCKTPEDAQNFEENMVPAILSANPDASISFIDSGAPAKSKYAYDIPLSYPIRVANSRYKYKSQYRPNPAGKEEAEMMADKAV